MHKFSSSDSFPKLHPIVSFIGTFNYNLTRFLCDLLSPLVLHGYSCKDTFSFVSQIKNANHSKKFIVPYIVTSLFTNIPLLGTINIAINLIFNHNRNLNITKKNFGQNNAKLLVNAGHTMGNVEFLIFCSRITVCMKGLRRNRMKSEHLPHADAQNSSKWTWLNKDVLNYEKITNNMFMLFYILLIYQITNCLLLVIDCQCSLTPKIFW